VNKTLFTMTLHGLPLPPLRPNFGVVGMVAALFWPS
jgi:hypothetical protein